MLTLLTLAAVVGFALLLASFVVGVAIGRVGRDTLRLELANLKGKHETLSQSYAHLRELAGTAIELAKQKHFPGRFEVGTSKGAVSDSNPYIDSVTRSLSNYQPPFDANCPKCFVSVRAEVNDWPVTCPACSTCFDQFGKLAGLDSEFISE